MASWLTFSLMALVLWGVWGLLSKVAAQNLPSQAVYLLAISGHLVVIAYLASQTGLAIPWHPVGVAAALAAGVAMAFGLLFFFRALAHGKASVVVPLTALYPVLTVVLSRVILQESLSPRQVAGVALALLAVWLLSR
jgi:transporter family protein